MRIMLLLTIVSLAACRENNSSEKPVVADSSVISEHQSTMLNDTVRGKTDEIIYANTRFKNVRVHKTGIDTYEISGEGQIFEASFNWVVEDGHNELQSGYTTTDAGAPAWGKFNFKIKIPARKNKAILHVIIYESSAKDGSRQYELPILLK